MKITGTNEKKHMDEKNITESPSKYSDLELQPVRQLLEDINQEDRQVPLAVESQIPQIEKLVVALVDRIKSGGRLFYLGAGRFPRLSVPLMIW